jgi:hypothetical protein
MAVDGLSVVVVFTSVCGRVFTLVSATRGALFLGSSLLFTSDTFASSLARLDDIMVQKKVFNQSQSFTVLVKQKQTNKRRTMVLTFSVMTQQISPKTENCDNGTASCNVFSP